MSPDRLRKIVNIGSSTFEFNKKKQHEIHELVFRPLEKRNLNVVNIDIKDADGVDIVCDILNAFDRDKVKKLRPDAVFCFNTLEHVQDPYEFCRALADLTHPSGLLFITLPHSYPYHKDPIDNGFRPDLHELLKLFPDFELKSGKVINCGTGMNLYRKNPVLLLRRLIRSMMPFYFYDDWKQTMYHWGWLFSPYLITGVIIEKVKNSA